MKRALIHKATRRLCQVAAQEFPVHPDLEWRDCADDVRPDTHDFDGAAFVAKPPPPPPPPPDPRLVADEQELAAAKLDAALLSLINMGPAQIATAIDNAFPDPAQRVILKRICRVLIPTARKVFR